ncbi:hypothetical protein ACF09L_28585 [Streptomyces sp. NPDC014779]|uniref:hypothetical protein n=1 Tax=Streptomyces sp. NPDC014779 TaxID=3364911 RepID=UPI0037034B3F
MTVRAEPAADGLLCVDPDGGAAEAWRECADLLCARLPRPHRAAVLLARHLLLRYPGCLASLVPRYEGGCAVAVRLGGGPQRVAVLVLTLARPARRSVPAGGPRPVR